MSFTQSLYKYEVAGMLDVSATTLRNWLNKRYYSELKELNYTKSQKKLTPKQLNFLQEKLDLQP